MRDGCQGQGNGLDRAWLAGLLPFHSLFMGNGVAARRFLHAKQSRGGVSVNEVITEGGNTCIHWELTYFHLYSPDTKSMKGIKS